MLNTNDATSVNTPNAPTVTPATARALDDDPLRALAAATNARIRRAREPVPAGINGALREMHRALQRDALRTLEDHCSILDGELERRGIRRGGQNAADASGQSVASARWNLGAPCSSPELATLEVAR